MSVPNPSRPRYPLPNRPQYPVERIPSRKPYTPKSGRAKAMTVAVGLVCNDGVVLGADTEISWSIGKTHESKIFPIDRKNGCFLTYAGDTFLIKELVESLRIRLQTGVNPSDYLEIVKEEYCSLLPSKIKDEDNPPAELLLTIRKIVNNDYKTVLYLLRGKRTFPVEKYAAIGIGQEFSQAMFEPRYNQFSRTFENLFVLIDALRKVKKYVQFCGGATNVIAVRNDDSIPSEDWGIQEIEQIEKDCEFFEKSLNHFFVAFPSPQSSETFGKDFETLKKQLIEYRQNRPISVPFV